ncbi:hypothetical protein TR13x_00795 [Caloranaerobacter sp. TR13]|uniref:hypothetical protein n=1 Tax=Caloranaerobacter sp. TR13 TaxID=1302151 RepID=UPI0006D3AE84|nr:hypothetical protein [Caloranaerobacter sp. TR13]KPU27921.1 hypothetical protein TR13x_00795 [Caloranaerobacter sp. TR13]
MGTRLEKLNERKLRHKIRQRRRLTILLVILILFIGLRIVDQSFIELLQIDDEKLFEYSYLNGIYKIQLMGNVYNIKKSDVDIYYEKYKTIVLNYVKQIKNLIVEFFKNEPGLSPVF